MKYWHLYPFDVPLNSTSHSSNTVFACLLPFLLYLYRDILIVYSKRTKDSEVTLNFKKTLKVGGNCVTVNKGFSYDRDMLQKGIH